MPAKIGCDAHKQFSVFVTIDGKGKTSPPVRVEHHRQQYIDFLRSLPPASEIALEATGHWYWARYRQNTLLFVMTHFVRL